MSTSHVTLLALLVVMMTSSVASQLINCYSCQASTASWYQPVGDCGENPTRVNSTAMQGCVGSYCVKQIVKYYTGGVVVARYCTSTSAYPSGCIYADSNTIQGWTWFCVCNSNFCNSAHRLKMSILTAPLILATIFVSKLLTASQ
jgi:hypothetical protein